MSILDRFRRVLRRAPKAEVEPEIASAFELTDLEYAQLLEELDAITNPPKETVAAKVVTGVKQAAQKVKELVTPGEQVAVQEPETVVPEPRTVAVPFEEGDDDLVLGLPERFTRWRPL